MEANIKTINYRKFLPLIAVNILPALGVWFLGWSFFSILIMYIIEMIAPSIIYCVKIAIASGPPQKQGPMYEDLKNRSKFTIILSFLFIASVTAAMFSYIMYFVVTDPNNSSLIRDSRKLLSIHSWIFVLALLISERLFEFIIQLFKKEYQNSAPSDCFRKGLSEILFFWILLLAGMAFFGSDDNSPAMLMLVQSLGVIFMVGAKTYLQYSMGKNGEIT